MCLVAFGQTDAAVYGLHHGDCYRCIVLYMIVLHEVDLLCFSQRQVVLISCLRSRLDQALSSNMANNYLTRRANETGSVSSPLLYLDPV